MYELDFLIERFENYLKDSYRRKNYAIPFDSFGLSWVLAELNGVRNELSKLKKNHEDEIFEMANFCLDEEKMKDFRLMTKEEFLLCYGYLTEQEYDNTAKIVKAVLDVYEH